MLHLLELLRMPALPLLIVLVLVGLAVAVASLPFRMQARMPADHRHLGGKWSGEWFRVIPHRWGSWSPPLLRVISTGTNTASPSDAADVTPHLVLLDTGAVKTAVLHRPVSFLSRYVPASHLALTG